MTGTPNPVHRIGQGCRHGDLDAQRIGTAKRGYLTGMARAMWSGSISFGLVSVPVKVIPAVKEHTVHFHQVDKRTGSRIRYEKVAEISGKEVGTSQIELGYEMGNGDMVVLESSELDELRPVTTRTIDITDFVELADVDPAYYAHTYWLTPDGDAAVRPYRLLVAAMDRQGRVGIGMVVMRNKQYLAAIRPRDGALALSTMHFDDEVVARTDISDLAHKSAKVDTKELKLATQIIDSLSGPWKPKKYHDTYTEEVKRLVQAHEEGKDIVTEEPPATEGQVIDLMEALQASVKATTSRAGRKRALSEAATELGQEAGRQDRSRDRKRSTPKRPSGAGKKSRAGRSKKGQRSRTASAKKATARKSA